MAATEVVMVIRLTGLLTVILSAVPLAAQTPVCDRLDGDRRELAVTILDSEYLYDCCDDTIGVCLAARPTCALAARLADNVCRRVAAGQDEERIRRALSRRARSMVGGGAPAEIELDDAYNLGSDDAPVTVAIYACARCPYCSRLVPELHDAISNGPLRDRVRLAFRVFPIRGHAGSTEAGLAFVAAAEMGAFWPYMLHAYNHFDDWSETTQIEWAAAVGLDPEEFATTVADPTTRTRLVASKKEGLVNRVEATPTLFINGQRWVGDLETDELVDAVAEVAARVGGRQWLED
jgi:protein-disulfide isomerase